MGDLYRRGSDPYLHFASPTGNIRCDLGSESDADFLTCYIRDHTWKDLNCPAGQFPAFGIGDTEALTAHTSCEGLPTDSSRYRALPYGHSVSGISIVCASSVEGMTCSDTNAPHGRFFLSRAKYALA